MNAVRRFYLEADKTRPEQDGFNNELKALALFDRDSGQRLLDIGCYDGSKTSVIREYLGAECVWGVDFLPDKLQMARQREIEVQMFDLNDTKRIGLDDQAFDCIFLGDIIEHVFSPDHLLDECRRLLRPGGYVVLTTPNLASWRNRLGLLIGWQPLCTEVSTVVRLGNPFAPEGVPSGHIRVFTPRALVELARLHGFLPEVLSGYMVNNTNPQGFQSRIFRLVDSLAGRISPSLCDELAVRLRKPVEAVRP